MEDQKPKYFTEDEIKALAELSKDAVRWTLSEKDFKEARVISKSYKMVFS